MYVRHITYDILCIHIYIYICIHTGTERGRDRKTFRVSVYIPS